MSYVWVVYSKGTFTGYSESLGNGRENKDMVAIFSTREKANSFVEEKKGWYARQDDELIIEKQSLDCQVEKPSVDNVNVAKYFMAHNSRR